ncbi:unnamed protein product, partial [Mesorhabditis belari]|uniref:C2H2-type domain-containing protein n=1 Tax=Mesorhabditis belari TaxID=2138241 RepID=A0AAF3EUG4_9BILA
MSSENPSTSGIGNVENLRDEAIEISEDFYPPDEQMTIINDGEFETEGIEVDDEETEFEYDPVTFNSSRGYLELYQFYQPMTVSDSQSGPWMCRICFTAGQSTSFATRQQFQHHRYKAHGTFAHNLPCPLTSCRQSHASLQSLKKHLKDEHELPIETHHRTFPDMQRFEQWRQLIESATGAKFLLHNKQKESRRQVMHCVRSEHKTGSALRKPRKTGESMLRMAKEGSCCPAHISFTLEKDGTVNVIYQMVHVGHGVFGGNEENGEKMTETPTVAEFRLAPRPTYLGEKPMQFLQIDIVEMSVSLYGMSRYTHILMITDLRTKYLWARPLQDFFDRNLLVRHFVDIFTQFGVPEGFSSSMNFELVRLAMKVIGFIFKTEIVEIGNQTPDYLAFRRNLYDMAANELNNRDRWAEMIPFVCLHYNQTPRGTEIPPFELMFDRSAFPGDDGESEAPAWLPSPHAPATIVFEPGDKVYMRNFDSSMRDSRKDELHLENIVLGLVGEVDWSRPAFPYHVFYSRERGNAWPDRTCDSMFVSPFDLAPSSIDLLLARDEERRLMLENLLCTCKTTNHPNSPQCNLLRSDLCTKAMSRACCSRNAPQCGYHEEYDAGAGETYFKLQQLCKKYRNDEIKSEQSPRKTVWRTKKSKKLKSQQHRIDYQTEKVEKMHSEQIHVTYEPEEERIRLPIDPSKEIEIDVGKSADEPMKRMGTTDPSPERRKSQRATKRPRIFEK